MSKMLKSIMEGKPEVSRTGQLLQPSARATATSRWPVGSGDLTKMRAPHHHCSHTDTWNVQPFVCPRVTGGERHSSAVGFTQHREYQVLTRVLRVLNHRTRGFAS